MSTVCCFGRAGALVYVVRPKSLAASSASPNCVTSHHCCGRIFVSHIKARQKYRRASGSQNRQESLRVVEYKVLSLSMTTQPFVNPKQLNGKPIGLTSQPLALPTGSYRLIAQQNMVNGFSKSVAGHSAASFLAELLKMPSESLSFFFGCHT
ncbi:hypothetical protein QQF64_030829 [Cirrhinus molitorella]|uniref:Uncharacterized protein n=1 Tax=Cirrhinus molitorella TaxID=172907 RepID=A0ABR3N4K3_9TELE